MLIKEAVYKKVRVTQKKLVSDEIHGCDECGCEIKEYPSEDSSLELKVFYKDHEKKTKDLHFCSWECVFLHIPKVKTDYFVDFPFLYYDAPKDSKRSAQHLIEVIRKSGLTKES